MVSNKTESENLHLEIWRVFIREKRYSLAFSTSTPRATNPVNITLHTCRKVIVDNLSNSLEIHASSHDFRCHHYPAFPLPHAAHSILSFLCGHACMQTTNI